MKVTNAYSPTQRPVLKHYRLVTSLHLRLLIVFLCYSSFHITAFAEDPKTNIDHKRNTYKNEFDLTMENVVDQSDLAILEALTDAANDGSAKAALALGNRYFEGTGVVLNKKTAVQWWSRANELLSPAAAYNLGVAYLNGDGTQKNLAEAKIAFTAAAKRDMPGAHLALGILELHVAKSQQDYKQAAAHFRRSAESGSEVAKHNLALMYEKGLGFAKNSVKADYWREFVPAPKTSTPLEQDKMDHVPTPSGQHVVHDTQWVMTRPTNNYTLQVASGDTFTGTKRLISKITGLDCAIFKKIFAEKERFVAIAGDFLSYADALSAIEQLPESFVQHKPFIVNFELLQRQINDHTKFNN